MGRRFAAGEAEENRYAVLRTADVIEGTVDGSSWTRFKGDVQSWCGFGLLLPQHSTSALPDLRDTFT